MHTETHIGSYTQNCIKKPKHSTLSCPYMEDNLLPSCSIPHPQWSGRQNQEKVRICCWDKHGLISAGKGQKKTSSDSKIKQNLTASHQQTDAQPVSQQQLAWITIPITHPVLQLSMMSCDMEHLFG